MFSQEECQELANKVFPKYIGLEVEDDPIQECYRLKLKIGRLTATQSIPYWEAAQYLVAPHAGRLIEEFLISTLSRVCISEGEIEIT
jgi:hypothetical protein